MLSVVHGASKFHCYIFGKPVTMYNDYKPLEQIFKNPLRLQKMLLGCSGTTFHLNTGKARIWYIVAADALSRAYLTNNDPDPHIADMTKVFDLLSVSWERQGATKYSTSSV